MSAANDTCTSDYVPDTYQVTNAHMRDLIRQMSKLNRSKLNRMDSQNPGEKALHTQSESNNEQQEVQNIKEIYDGCSIMLIPHPIGWEKVFTEAKSELMLLDKHLANLGPYFPHTKDLFKAFELCPLDKIKVVILGQDPYHAVHNGEPQANGMAFSTNIGCPIQPSLNNIYKELCLEYPNYVKPTHGDLSAWAKQGVLLLNTCLTVKPHAPRSHKNIWNGFLARILNAIGAVNTMCIYLLWGQHAQDKAYLMGERSIKLTASHPSPFSATRGSKDVPPFIGCRHFIKVNEFLQKQNLPPIDWQIY